ncbi:unnamed protein product [Coregonus sp. 'balchen']|nr:unnamed protein product [Coregonus sp. 'balchen']
MINVSFSAKRTNVRRSERLSPPLDIQLETVNCTAFSVRWKMPRRHVSTITGYKGQLDGQASFDVDIGNLKVATQYRVSVGAYGWAGEGRPSMPRDRCVCPRHPPTQPTVMAVSDTELALSWTQGESEGSAPVLHFLVAYIRPELDTEWTYIREPIEANSMVLKGLSPDTEFQFVVRAANIHGVSPPSAINNPIRTPGTAELKPFPAIPNGDNQRSQLRSRSGTPSSQPGGNVIYRMGTATPNATLLPSPSSDPELGSPLTPVTPELVTISPTTDRSSPSPSPTTPSTPPMTQWMGPVPRLYDLACEDTVCPPDSFCLSDYDSGGSRCHCNLGRRVTVQFPRFNCGTGAAQIVSETRMVPGQWHTVTVFRDGVSGWLRMDNDTPVSGRSQGQYTKITFRSPLYVGGAPTAYWLVRATGSNRGFQGCIQSLTINNKATDLRPWPLGSALSGADIGRVVRGALPNRDLLSQTGGTGTSVWPSGFRGPGEESFLLSLPLFNETMFSYASAPWPQSLLSYLSFMEFEITFQPTSPDGTLLYSDDAGSRDFLSINLVEGYVEFRFDCGSGGSGAFTQIKCSSPLYIGGVPQYDKTKSAAAVRRPFSGTIQKLVLNDRSILLTKDFALGVNVENAAHPCVESPCANGGTCRPKWDRYECDCPLGYDGRHCQKVWELLFKQVSGVRTNMFMRFKSTAKDGLLLWRGDSQVRPNSDFLSLGLQDGALIFSYNLGSGVANVIVNGTFSDGRWHRVKAVRDGQSGKLTVDDYGAKTGRSPGKMRQLNVNGVLYYSGGLVGCVSHFTLSTDYHLSLVEDAADGKNINTCTN